MRFGQLDRRMRVFETAHDHCVLPGIFLVARIDGRSLPIGFLGANVDGDRYRPLTARETAPATACAFE